MNIIIICGIPMKDRVDPSIYVSDDKSIPASSRPVRFPINAFLEETMKSDDSIKFLLLVKKDTATIKRTLIASKKSLKP